ncbi:hypothetical protein D3C81_2021080 [compost metagenome]
MAGSRVMAISMLVMNMKVSSRPMSAWNFSAEKDQVATPTDKVMAVNTVATPTSRKASWKAPTMCMPSARCSCRRL